jgi:hypothetical protein
LIISRDGSRGGLKWARTKSCMGAGPGLALRRRNEAVQVLKIPGIPADDLTPGVAHLAAMCIDEVSRRKPIATGFLLAAVAPGLSDQPVIKLVQKDEQGKLRGISQFHRVQLAPPTTRI